jgi:error-prone DNA polymerase
MNMLPRLKPRTLYDLVIQVAIVRPGPIQGDMVHPYLRRRDGSEPVVFPSPAPPHPADELHGVLSKTCGVPLFQEQAMKLAIVAAEFTPEQANGLRRAMATFRNVGTMWKYEQLMIGGMVRRGYEPEYARRCFEQIKGFGSYGFPESHAASFAKLVYISAWLKCHYPAVFACALLNSQPMGFYAPAQIVREAQERGVEARAIDVNASAWDNTLEGTQLQAMALRLGYRQIGGFHQDWAISLVENRPGGYGDIESLRRRTNLPGRALRLLADADAFRSLGLDRRDALWEVRRLPDDSPLPLFEAADARELGEEPLSFLPAMPLSEHIAADYQTTRLSLKGHPMQILRPVFRDEGVLTCAGISKARDGSRARTAGVVLVRQRPGQGTAIFITLEDETGTANVVLWARQFEHFRREVMSARLLLIEGKVQRSKDNVVHLMAEHVSDRTFELKRLSEDDQPMAELNRADEFPPSSRAGHPRNVRILPKSRDFH